MYAFLCLLKTSTLPQRSHRRGTARGTNAHQLFLNPLSCLLVRDEAEISELELTCLSICLSMHALHSQQGDLQFPPSKFPRTVSSCEQMDIKDHCPPHLVAKCTLLYTFSYEFSFSSSPDFQMIIIYFPIPLQDCATL